jgi:glutathione synthase/RimK-type ligase-like ATP-grasp enzyme
LNKPRIVIAGGCKDSNLHVLRQKLVRRGIDCLEIGLGSSNPKAIRWEMDSGELAVDDTVVIPQAIFQRYDFAPQLTLGSRSNVNRATAWYLTLEAYALAHSKIRYFNRHAVVGVGNKPFVLATAQGIGLEIPTTSVTNDLTFLRSNTLNKIAKPLNGGGYCRHLSQSLKELDDLPVGNSPAIVQELLTAPEWRVYVVGDSLLSFKIESPSLDYRELQDASITFVDTTPSEVGTKLLALAKKLGLTFAAADFKTNAATQQWIFLEINSAPMFAAFDTYANGGLTDRMADFLMS